MPAFAGGGTGRQGAVLGGRGRHWAPRAVCLCLAGRRRPLHRGECPLPGPPWASRRVSRRPRSPSARSPSARPPALVSHSVRPSPRGVCVSRVLSLTRTPSLGLGPPAPGGLASRPSLIPAAKAPMPDAVPCSGSGGHLPPGDPTSSPARGSIQHTAAHACHHRPGHISDGRREPGLGREGAPGASDIVPLPGQGPVGA